MQNLEIPIKYPKISVKVQLYFLVDSSSYSEKPYVNPALQQIPSADEISRNGTNTRHRASFPCRFTRRHLGFALYLRVKSQRRQSRASVILPLLRFPGYSAYVSQCTRVNHPYSLTCLSIWLLLAPRNCH